METTCYAVMALNDRGSAAREQAVDLLLKIQNPVGPRSKATIRKGAGPPHHPSLFGRAVRTTGEVDTVAPRSSKGVKVIGSGNGNSERPIAPCNLTGTSTDGHSFPAR
jgi:hypothetical protein